MACSTSAHHQSNIRLSIVGRADPGLRATEHLSPDDCAPSVKIRGQSEPEHTVVRAATKIATSVDCQAWFNPTFGNCVKSIVRIGEVAEAKIEAKYRFDAERLILEKVVTTGSRSEFEVRETTTFQNWNFEVVPDEAECRLSFFGLPEPRSNEPARSTPTWVWALLLGVVFLLAAFFVRRREQGA